MNSITQGLMAAGCEVRVLAMCSDKHPVHDELMTPEYKEATRFEAVYVDLGIHPLDAAVAALCGESYHVKRFVSKDFSAKLKQVLEEETFDVVHVESLFLTPYVPLQAPDYYSEESLFFAPMMKNIHVSDRATKMSVIRSSDAFSVGVDLPNFNQDIYFKRRNTEMVAIPFGISAEAMGHVDEEPCSLFHLGSMDWIPNQEGVRWFLEKVWPMVHERVPQVTLYLAGRKMPDDLMRLEMEGVKVVGEVPDAMYFIGSKQINVVPLLSGSGIRVKIIEAMSIGKTVISTSVGADGIHYTDGKNLLIADTPEQFVEQIERCVTDADFCREVGRNAFALIEEEYGNEGLTRKLLDFYEKHINQE